MGGPYNVNADSAVPLKELSAAKRATIAATKSNAGQMTR
jgi:hypothetical protein